MVGGGLVNRFAAAALEAGAEIVRAPSRNAAFDTLLKILQTENIKTVVASPSFRSSGIGEKIPFVIPHSAKDFERAAAGVVKADFGAAETGTLVHLDTDHEEKMAWTLPPLCLCLLEASRIVPDLESLAEVFREHLKRPEPSGLQVSLVTGPSRTADIECQLTIGVQGPARLVIVIVEGKGD